MISINNIVFKKARNINIVIFAISIVVSLLPLLLNFNIYLLAVSINSFLFSFILILLISIINALFSKNCNCDKTLIYLIISISLMSIISFYLNKIYSNSIEFQFISKVSIFISFLFLLIWMNHPYLFEINQIKLIDRKIILRTHEKKLFLPNKIYEIDITGRIILFQRSVIDDNVGLKLNVLKFFYRTDFWYHKLLIREDGKKVIKIKIAPIQENSQKLINSLLVLFQHQVFKIDKYPKLTFPYIIPKLTILNNVPKSKINKTNLINLESYYELKSMNKYEIIPPRPKKYHYTILVINFILILLIILLLLEFIKFTFQNEFSGENDGFINYIIILFATLILFLKQFLAIIVTLFGNHSLEINESTFNLQYGLKFFPVINIELPLSYNPFLRETKNIIHLILLGDKSRIEFKVPLFKKSTNK